MPTDLLIAETPRRLLDEALAAGRAEGGWLFAGPEGVGKATTARAFTAAHLSGAQSLSAAEARTTGLVENGAHPDLQTLRRQTNEKTGKPYTVIRVDEVREANDRLFRTSATGRRAVIVDTADEMNRQAANAILKSLEEPPAGTLFVLLTKAVGGLLPTIRSRCRVVSLPPVEPGVLVPWLQARTEASEEEAAKAARAGGGAPGRALALLEDGQAMSLAERFLEAAAGRGDLLAAAKAAGAKAGEDAWPAAWGIVTERIGGALRGVDDPLLKAAGPNLLSALDEARALAARAEGLNADRTQTVFVLGQTIGRGLRAGR
jgi:DNA polymerase-3 subunit delta'